MEIERDGERGEQTETGEINGTDLEREIERWTKRKRGRERDSERERERSRE